MSVSNWRKLIHHNKLVVQINKECVNKLIAANFYNESKIIKCKIELIQILPPHCNDDNINKN